MSKFWSIIDSSLFQVLALALAYPVHLPTFYFQRDKGRLIAKCFTRQLIHAVLCIHPYFALWMFCHMQWFIVWLHDDYSWMLINVSWIHVDKLTKTMYMYTLKWNSQLFLMPSCFPNQLLYFCMGFCGIIIIVCEFVVSFTCLVTMTEMFIYFLVLQITQNIACSFSWYDCLLVAWWWWWLSYPEVISFNGFNDLSIYLLVLRAIWCKENNYSLPSFGSIWSLTSVL